jgi:hypothetical protein
MAIIIPFPPPNPASHASDARLRERFETEVTCGQSPLAKEAGYVWRMLRELAQADRTGTRDILKTLDAWGQTSPYPAVQRLAARALDARRPRRAPKQMWRRRA